MSETEQLIGLLGFSIWAVAGVIVFTAVLINAVREIVSKIANSNRYLYWTAGMPLLRALFISFEK